MSGQFFGDRFNSPEIVEKTIEGTNSPLGYSDPYIDKAPMDADLINETPVSDTDSVDDVPMDEMIVDEVVFVKETPLYGTPVVDERVVTRLM